MISSVSQGRKIASNRLFTGHNLLSDPVVTVDKDGVILAVEQCASPDRLAGVEFFAGVLTPGLADAWCGELTPGAVLHHINAGTRCAGYVTPDRSTPAESALIYSHRHEPDPIFLAQYPSEIPFPETGMIVVDRPLTPQDAERFMAQPAVCLCPRTMERKELPGTLALLRRWGINPALGSYAPGSEPLPLGEILFLLAGEPVSDILEWATVQGAQMLGFGDSEIAPGSRCGLNLLSGLNYPAMRLTTQTRLMRII